MRNYAPIEKGARDIARGFATEGDAVASILAQARARKANADAALSEDRLTNKATGQRRFVAGATGLRDDQAEQLIAALSGKGFPQGPTEGPPTAQGDYPTMEQVPQWVTPEVRQNYNQAQQVIGLNDMAHGDSKANDLVKVLLDLKGQQLQNDVLSGTQDPDKVAQAVAAVAGKPTVDVTGTGISYNPYGDKSDLNTAAFEKRFSKAGQLPAEAKMVQFYKSMGYSNDKAVELARSRKNIPIRQLAAEMYAVIRKNIIYDPAAKGKAPEELDAMAEEQVIQALDFVTRNEQRFGGGEEKPPVEGAKRAPDNKWYVPDPQRPGKYLQVTQ